MFVLRAPTTYRKKKKKRGKEKRKKKREKSFVVPVGNKFRGSNALRRNGTQSPRGVDNSIKLALRRCTMPDGRIHRSSGHFGRRPRNFAFAGQSIYARNSGRMEETGGTRGEKGWAARVVRRGSARGGGRGAPEGRRETAAPTRRYEGMDLDLKGGTTWKEGVEGSEVG